MSKKTYATKVQRELLEGAGLPHKPGRTKEDAEKLIKIYMSAGKIPKDYYEKATPKQIEAIKNQGRAFLAKHDVDLDSLSREKASELMNIITSGEVTDRQKQFMIELGWPAQINMSKRDASTVIDFMLARQCVSCGDMTPHVMSVDRCINCNKFIRNVPIPEVAQEVWNDLSLWVDSAKKKLNVLKKSMADTSDDSEWFDAKYVMNKIPEPKESANKIARLINGAYRTIINLFGKKRRKS